jgi:cytochrome c-type biogenesis protein CcmF
MLSEMGNFFLAMAVGFASVQALASFWGVIRSCVSLNKASSRDLDSHNEILASQDRVLESLNTRDLGSSHPYFSWVPGIKKIHRSVYASREFSKSRDDVSGEVGNLVSGSAEQKLSNKFLTLCRVATFLQGSFISAAFLTLITAFVVCDFSITTVAFHDHTQLPWYYRMAATWGNHEGSLLLFVLILSGIGVALATFLKDPLFRARTLSIQGLLTLIFLLFLILTSNPFTPLPITLSEGNSLNPLLQDRGLLFHPPLLYLGYVGFSAPFSIAIAALWGGENVKTWDTIVRPWVHFAWGALTAGIALGSWWAYYELGWGGWWFWDPVENASLMPWLAGMALLHTLRTESLYRWSLFLSLLTFGLSLLGTFLVRSGLVTSVHSFAQDPTRGFFILCLLGGIMGFAFFMWVWKSPRLQSPQLLFFSRQGALLLNSLLNLVGLATVFLGTLYPLWSDFMWSEKIAIGAPYFERTFIPLMIPFLVLIPLGSVFRERGESLFPLLITPMTAALGAATLLLFALNPTSLWAFTGIVVAIWVLGGTMVAFTKKRLAIGPTLAHLGVGITLLGVSVGGGFRSDETRILGFKENLDVRGTKLTLQNVQQGKGPTYLYEKAILTTPAGVLTPEKRLYQPHNSLLNETAILTNGLRDLYVTLGPYQGDHRWLIRASSIPLAPWIWSGGFFMVLGALFSYLGNRFSGLLSPRRSPNQSLLTNLRKKNWIASDTLCPRNDDPPAPSLRGAQATKQSKAKQIYLLFLVLLSLPISSSANVSRETKAQALYRQVRCPECAGQSITESESPESRALRGFIDEQLKEGKSDEEILDELRTLFGDDVLFRPPFQANTLFLWLAPFGLFFLILILFFWKGYRSQAKK